MERLLRRTWYIDQLQHTHPELYERSRHEIEVFRASLVKFERDEPYDANVVEQQYRDVIRGFVDKNIAEHPIFATAELEQEYTPGYVRIAEGLAFRLYAHDDGAPVEFPKWQYRDVPIRNYYCDKIREMYMVLAASRGKYLVDHRQFAEAERYYTYALSFVPKTPPPPGEPTAMTIARSAQQIAAAREDCRAKMKQQ